jgi:hypothetical protein
MGGISAATRCWATIVREVMDKPFANPIHRAAFYCVGVGW